MSMYCDATSCIYCRNSSAYGYPDEELERFMSGDGGVPPVKNMMPPGFGVTSMSGVGVPVVSGVHGEGVPVNNGPCGMRSSSSASADFANVYNIQSGMPNANSVPSGMPNCVSGGTQSMPQPIQLVPQMNPYPMPPHSQPQQPTVQTNMDNYPSRPGQHMQTVMSEPLPETMDVHSSFPSGIIHAPQAMYDPNYNYNVGFRHYSPVYPVAEPLPVQGPVPNVYVPTFRNVSRFSYDEPIQEEMRGVLKGVTFTPISSEHEPSAWGICGVRRIPGSSDLYSYGRRAFGSRSSSEEDDEQQLEKELEALERRIDEELKSAD